MPISSLISSLNGTSITLRYDFYGDALEGEILYILDAPVGRLFKYEVSRPFFFSFLYVSIASDFVGIAKLDASVSRF